MLVKYNYAKGEHITRFLNRNDPRARLALGHRACRRAAANGIDALTTVESIGQEPLRGHHRRRSTKRLTDKLQFQVNYTYS